MLELVWGLLNPTMVLVTAFLVAVYAYSTWTHSHWSRLGVPSPEPPVPLFGHAMPSMLGRMHFMDVLHDLYRKMGTDQRFAGIYTMRTPQLLVKDPELIGTCMPGPLYAPPPLVPGSGLNLQGSMFLCV